MADPSDDEKLDRMFALLKGPAELTPEEAELEAKWPSLVDRAVAEAGKRRRRRILFFVALVLVLLLGGVATVYFLADTDDPAKALGPKERVTATTDKDLAEPSTLAKCARFVRFTDSQRTASEAIAATYSKRFVDEAPSTHVSLRAELRAKIEVLLDDRQRPRFRAICAELDRRRTGSAGDK